MATALVAAGTAWAADVIPATSRPAADAGPDLSAFTQSVRVPFARLVPASTRAAAIAATRPVVDFDHLTGMNVRISVNGGRPLTVQVDTGSVGVILGASDVPNIDPNAPPGEMVYSSSGNGYYGVWTPSTITFLDAQGPDGGPVTAQVPVLAAREYRFTPGAVNGGAATRPVNHNPHPYMFGIGFGRGRDPHQERNPFVNLTRMRAGTMRRGYTVTRDGVTLGLSGADVGRGYAWQHLAERQPSNDMRRLAPGLRDWETSRGWVVVDGHRGAEVPVLLDTGLTNFILWTPGLAAVEDLPRGTPVEVDLLGGQLHYRFRSAEAKDPRSADPVVPLKVSRSPTTSPTASVNTGLRALAIYDYLYDADGGYLGLRPTATHP